MMVRFFSLLRKECEDVVQKKMHANYSNIHKVEIVVENELESAN